eukprot:scaffold3973_cov161-Amphora_coffeaeformis.AAC.16
MPGKRANEHGQMRREEYEEVMERASSSEEVTRGIPRASEEQLRKRRIVKARQQTAAASATSDASSTNNNNPFANFAAARSSPPAAATNNTNPFAGMFSFATRAPAPVAASSEAPRAKINNGKSRTPTVYERRTMDLEVALWEAMGNVDGSNGSYLNETILKNYMKIMVSQVNAWAEDNPEQAGRDPAPPTAAAASPGTTTAPTPVAPPAAPVQPPAPAAPAAVANKFTFGFPNGNATPAPAPPAAANKFTFGFPPGSATPAPAPPAPGGFSFGTGTVGAQSSDVTSNPAPAPGGFSFGVGTTPAAAPAGTDGFSLANSTQEANKAAVATTTPGFSFDNKPAAKDDDDDDDAPIPADDNDPGIEKEKDLGWDNLLDEPLLALASYHDKEKNKDESIGRGMVKLQRSQEEPTICRVMMRDEGGGLRLLLNVKIQSNMTLSERSNNKHGEITFYGVRIPDRGAEVLKLKSRKENHEKLFAKMREMKGFAAGN